MTSLRPNMIERSVNLNNYKTFISSAECVSNVRNKLVVMEGLVHNVIDCLPKLVDKCHEFEAEAQHISNQWQEVSHMLAKHPQVLEVLEIPQLMDTCVRNGFYEEALHLYFYIQKLNKSYGQSIPIITSIAKDTEVFKEVMINQLVKEMSANIQLQNCLRIVSYLRQINKFSESELRIKFLSARDEWLSSLIRDIPGPNPLVRITKVIETNRVHLFDIVTQYRAIFSDSEPIVSQNHLYFGIRSIESNLDMNDSVIINSWLLYKINQFLQILSTYLNQWANNQFANHYQIENVIDPSFYFGLSMSRIGADFRPQLVPIINEAICRRFSLVVNEATDKFEKSIQNFTLTSRAINSSASVGANEQYLIPPSSLLEFPLLAHYCNDMLTAMNEIRRTTPLMAITSLTNIMNDSFNRISNAISKYFRAEESGLTVNERQVLFRFCEQYRSELLPHLIKCFESIVPMKSVANKLGISFIEFNKVRNCFSSICLESVTNSVSRLMSSKETTNIEMSDSVTAIPVSDPIVSDNSLLESETNITIK